MLYRKTALSLLLGLLLFLSFFEPVKGQQDYLNYANKIQKQQDYLAAAKLYQYVIEITKDSTIRTEALYRSKKVGDLAVSIINDMRWHVGGIVESLINYRINYLKEIGYNIKLVTMYETYYVNADTVTPNILLNPIQ